MSNILKINLLLCLLIMNSSFLIAEESDLVVEESDILIGEYDALKVNDVSIHIIDDSSLLGPKLRSAIAIGNNYILSSDLSPNGKFSVISNNKEYPANYISSSETGELMLFRVPNLNLINIPFAVKSIGSGRSLFIHHFNKDGDIRDHRGSIQKKLSFPEKPSISAFSHNLDDSLSRESAGAPLFNNCGEIVGINVANKNKTIELKSNYYAVDNISIIKFLRTQDINFTQSKEVCFSESEKRIIIANEVKKKALEAKNAEKEKEQSDELRIKAEKENKELERSKSEIEEKNAIQDAFNKNLFYAGSLSGLALIILIFFLIRNNRKRKMQLGLAEKTIAAREALHVDPGPDFVLRGSDLTIKIPGEKLGLDQGVVLGRNTSEADVILDKSEISRTHLRFIMRDDKIFADDLGSANGTILNGARLSAGRPMALHNKDEITLAGIIFIVEGL